LELVDCFQVNQYDEAMWNNTTSASKPVNQQANRPASKIISTLRKYCPLLLIGCLLLILSPSTLTAQQSIPFADYLALISRSQEMSQAASNQGGAACTTALNQIAQTLTSFTHVRLPDGTEMVVNHEGVFAVLQASPCNVNGMAAYLAGICPLHLCSINRAPSDQAATSAPAVPSSSDVTPNNNSSNSPQTTPLNPTDTNNPFENTAPAALDVTSSTVPAQPGQVPQANMSSLADTAKNGEAENTAVSPQPDTSAANTAVSEADAVAAEAGSEADESGGEAQPEEVTGDATTAGNEAGEGETAVSTDPAAEQQPGETGEVAGKTDVTDNLAVSPDAPAGENAEPGEGETAVTPPDVPNPDETTGDASIPPEPEIPETNQTLFIGIALTLILLIVFLVILFIRLKRAEDTANQQQKKQPTTPTEAVAEGRRKIEEGAYREAVRQLFLATVLALEERGIMQFDKTLTNYELLTKLQNKQTLIETLLPVVDTVERVWYGFEPLATAEFDALARQIDAIKQTA
jgi:hypothetical protein